MKKYVAWLTAAALLLCGLTACSGSVRDSGAHVDCEYTFVTENGLLDFLKTDDRLADSRDGQGRVTAYLPGAVPEGYSLTLIRTVSYGSYYAFYYSNPAGERYELFWQPSAQPEKLMEAYLDESYTEMEGGFFLRSPETDEASPAYCELLWVEQGQFFSLTLTQSVWKEWGRPPRIKAVPVETAYRGAESGSDR